MSTTVIYKCDRCGKESTNEKEIDLAIVGIGVKREKYSSYPEHNYDLADHCNRETEMCGACRIELGILPPKKRSDGGMVAPVPPSLEDVIREIIREEIYDANR